MVIKFNPVDPGSRGVGLLLAGAMAMAHFLCQAVTVDSMYGLGFGVQGRFHDLEGVGLGQGGNIRGFDSSRNWWVWPLEAWEAGLWLARNEGMDLSCSPYITHCGSFHFLPKP